MSISINNTGSSILFFIICLYNNSSFFSAVTYLYRDDYSSRHFFLGRFLKPIFHKIKIFFTYFKFESLTGDYPAFIECTYPQGNGNGFQASAFHVPFEYCKTGYTAYYIFNCNNTGPEYPLHPTKGYSRYFVFQDILFNSFSCLSFRRKFYINYYHDLSNHS